MSLTHPNTPVSQKDLQDFYHKIVPYMGSSSASTILTQTLTAGTTSVTFTGIPTEGDHIINFYTSSGINYTAISPGVGTVSLTYESQSADVTVFCEIKGV